MAKNVILLTLDTLRRDVCGCYGSREGLTPFIDSLADKCVRFDKCQAIGPYSHASFPGILTSSYTLDWPDHNRADKLHPERTLISEALKEAGPATAAFHSNPEMCDFFGWNRGWDVFYDSLQEEVTPQMPYIKGDRINRKVDGWLSTHVSGGEYRPFFLWTHYMDIHEPYVPPRKYVDMVDPSISLNADEMFALFNDVIKARDVTNAETVELLRKLYLAHVREVDDYVKDFFDTLADCDVLGDSVVIITADHGDEFGEHGSLSHDGKMYRELIDVPLLIFQPDRNEPAVCGKLVSNIDLPPTVLHLFSLEPCGKFQGTSLLPVDQYPDKACFGEAIAKEGRMKPEDKPIYYCREGDLKVIYHAGRDCWEMYDLAADSGERSNVADSHPQAGGMKAKLRPRIDRHHK